MSFQYFAFGSNLLIQRLHMGGCTSARVFSIAKLDNYKLVFVGSNKRWHGAHASIQPCEGSHVWGVVYQIDDEQKSLLDRQEGVHLGTYKPHLVNVVTPNGSETSCVTYRSNDTVQNPPSPFYRHIIARGAELSGLPVDYVCHLEKIAHNQYEGECELYDRVREWCHSEGVELSEPSRGMGA